MLMEKNFNRSRETRRRDKLRNLVLR